MDKQKITSILVVFEAVLLVVVLVFGILTNTTDGENNIIGDNRNEQLFKKDSESETQEDSEFGSSTVVVYQEERITFSAEVEDKLAQMTAEEKVAQLFLVSTEALIGVEGVTVAGNGTRDAINQYPVGGLVYSGGSFLSGAQIEVLISGTQSYSQNRVGLPLFIAVEESGGAEGSPVANACLYDVTKSISELAASQDADQVTDAVSTRANYLSPLGFNMMLGAVGNLADGKDAAYDALTYGSDAEVVSQMVAAHVRASKEIDVVSTLGVFPRKGNSGDFSELTEAELSVFQAGIDAGATAIIVSNSYASTLTGDSSTPCSMAEGAVAKLRGEMGYTGILMTAPFNEEAITSAYSSGDAAVNAIVAGMDMIYMPENFVEAYEAVLEAVNDGTISQMRLENAVGRILSEKME